MRERDTRMIERHGPSYRVVWRFDGRKQRLTAPTYEDALEIRAQLEKRRRLVSAEDLWAATRPRRVAEPDTVGVFCGRYVESLTGIEEATRKEYRRIVEQEIAAAALGDVPVGELTRETVRGWLQGMERREPRPLAPKTIANYHSLLSAAMGEAVAQSLTAVNPCHGVRLPRRDDHTTVDEHVYLEPAEVRLIAARIHEFAPWCSHVPILLADTGLRWGELTALQVGDVDVLAGTLRVGRAWKRGPGGGQLGAPKSRMSRRTVVIGDDALDVLAGLVAGRRSTEFVVTSSDSVSRLPRSTFTRHWWRALYGEGTVDKPDGGLVGEGVLEKRPHLHSLRHTHASWLISAGASLAFVQAQLGHEDISTTIRVYSHLMPNTRDELRAALRRAKSSDALTDVGDTARADLPRPEAAGERL